MSEELKVLSDMVDVFGNLIYDIRKIQENYNEMIVYRLEKAQRKIRERYDALEGELDAESDRQEKLQKGV